MAYIDDVNVTAREFSDRTRSFLTDEREPFLSRRRVLIPPNVVCLSANRDERAQLHRIRRGSSAAAAAAIPDFDAVVPNGNEENSVAHEQVVRVGRSHRPSEARRPVAWLGDTTYHKLS